MRITLERDRLAVQGYRVMEGVQEKTHIGYVRPALGGDVWWAFDLSDQMKGAAMSRLAAARLLRS